MPRIGEVLRLHVSIPWSVIRVGLVEHPSNVSAIERHHDSTTTNRRGGSDIGREAHGRRGCVAAQLESKRLGRAQIRALEVSLYVNIPDVSPTTTFLVNTVRHYRTLLACHQYSSDRARTEV